MKPQDLLGRCFVWEPSSPNALAMVVVTEVKWNGEEWWVTTCELTAGYTYWNTLERFNEATTMSTENGQSSAPSASRCYVLVYVGDEGEWRFFKDQNLYLGVANLTDSVEHAAMMTLDEAEGKWGCMSVKADWQVWSVRPGIVLDAMSDRHVIRAKKAALEAELKSLPPCI